MLLPRDCGISGCCTEETGCSWQLEPGPGMLPRTAPHKDVCKLPSWSPLDTLSSVRMFVSGWDSPQRRLFPWEVKTPRSSMSPDPKEHAF